VASKFFEYKDAIRARIVAHFDLTDEEFEAIFDKASLIDMPKGKTLFQEGKPNSSVYFIATGEADIYKSGVKLNSVGEGDVLGEMSLVGATTSSATVEARTDMALFRFGKDTFDVLLNRFPHLNNSIVLEALARKLQQNDI
jgi:CRP/FNR family transcriptional regulator